MKIKLTIFTPTYNRKNELRDVYKSLLEQTNKEFNWLIIDDGSTDNTEDLVNEWIKNNKINIAYYKKENGGKHTAYNYALDKCDTDYMFVALDSDNTMTKKAVEQINNILNEKYPNLSKGIYQKGGPGVNGVYNQDNSKHTMLVEIGGPDNTTDEVLNSTLAFCDAFLEVISKNEG